MSTTDAPNREKPTTSYYRAGGNFGGDCDIFGNPVVEGKWYATLAEDDWNHRTISGPFDDENEVRDFLNLSPVGEQERTPTHGLMDIIEGLVWADGRLVYDGGLSPHDIEIRVDKASKYLMDRAVRGRTV